MRLHTSAETSFHGILGKILKAHGMFEGRLLWPCFKGCQTLVFQLVFIRISSPSPGLLHVEVLALQLLCRGELNFLQGCIKLSGSWLSPLLNNNIDESWNEVIEENWDNDMI